MIMINKVPYEIQYFPDGTLNMTNLDIYNLTQYNLHMNNMRITINWKYSNPIEQVVIYNLVNHFRDKWNIKYISLDMPYVPNARMDRTKKQFSEIHTLKYFCKFINDLQFDKVTVLDVHSHITNTLLDRCSEIYPTYYITEAIKQSYADCILFPDKGAYDRYKDMCSKEKLPILYGEKIRCWETGKITGYEIKNPANLQITRDLNCLIIDDICSYGGTFHHATNALFNLGIEYIYLYITHCENNILKGDAINNSNLKHIYTTDSIFTEQHDKITVFEL